MILGEKQESKFTRMRHLGVGCGIMRWDVQAGHTPAERAYEPVSRHGMLTVLAAKR
jgi:hypothetical protein